VCVCVCVCVCVAEAMASLMTVYANKTMWKVRCCAQNRYCELPNRVVGEFPGIVNFSLPSVGTCQPRWETTM